MASLRRSASYIFSRGCNSQEPKTTQQIVCSGFCMFVAQRWCTMMWACETKRPETLLPLLYRKHHGFPTSGPRKLRYGLLRAEDQVGPACFNRASRTGGDFHAACNISDAYLQVPQRRYAFRQSLCAWLFIARPGFKPCTVCRIASCFCKAGQVFSLHTTRRETCRLSHELGTPLTQQQELSLAAKLHATPHQKLVFMLRLPCPHGLFLCIFTVVSTCLS